MVDSIHALADHCPEVRNGEVTLVMDNARIHQASDARDYLRDNNHIYLPPYSPELNQIELVFGVLIKRFRGRGVVNSEGQMQRRVNDITDEMNRELDIQTFNDHVRRFVQRAMNCELFN